MAGLGINTTALDAACDRLLADFERAANDGLLYAAQRTARQARESHWYQNRTGDLQASTQAAQTTVGSLWDDTLHTWAAAGEPYASYVDARSPILSPAYEAVETEIDAHLSTLFEAALR